MTDNNFTKKQLVNSNLPSFSQYNKKPMVKNQLQREDLEEYNDSNENTNYNINKNEKNLNDINHLTQKAKEKATYSECLGNQEKPLIITKHELEPNKTPNNTNNTVNFKYKRTQQQGKISNEKNFKCINPNAINNLNNQTNPNDYYQNSNTPYNNPIKSNINNNIDYKNADPRSYISSNSSDTPISRDLILTNNNKSNQQNPVKIKIKNIETKYGEVIKNEEDLFKTHSKNNSNSGFDSSNNKPKLIANSYTNNNNNNNNNHNSSSNNNEIKKGNSSNYNDQIVSLDNKTLNSMGNQKGREINIKTNSVADSQCKVPSYKQGRPNHQFPSNSPSKNFVVIEDNNTKNTLYENKGGIELIPNDKYNNNTISTIKINNNSYNYPYKSSQDNHLHEKQNNSINKSQVSLDKNKNNNEVIGDNGQTPNIKSMKINITNNNTQSTNKTDPNAFKKGKPPQNSIASNQHHQKDQLFDLRIPENHNDNRDTNQFNNSNPKLKSNLKSTEADYICKVSNDNNNINFPNQNINNKNINFESVKANMPCDEMQETEDLPNNNQQQGLLDCFSDGENMDLNAKKNPFKLITVNQVTQGPNLSVKFDISKEKPKETRGEGKITAKKEAYSLTHLNHHFNSNNNDNNNDNNNNNNQFIHYQVSADKLNNNNNNNNNNYNYNINNRKNNTNTLNDIQSFHTSFKRQHNHLGNLDHYHYDKSTKSADVLRTKSNLFDQLDSNLVRTCNNHYCESLFMNNYLKSCKKVSQYIYKNKKQIKLFGSEAYTNKNPDNYLMRVGEFPDKAEVISHNIFRTSHYDPDCFSKLNEKTPKHEVKVKEYRDFIKEKNKIVGTVTYKVIEDQIDQIALTPIPSKSRKMMKNGIERNEFLDVERNAVFMRRWEYTHNLYNKKIYVTNEIHKFSKDDLRERLKQQMEKLKEKLKKDGDNNSKSNNNNNNNNNNQREKVNFENIEQLKNALLQQKLLTIKTSNTEGEITRELLNKNKQGSNDPFAKQPSKNSFNKSNSKANLKKGPALNNYIKQKSAREYEDLYGDRGLMDNEQFEDNKNRIARTMVDKSDFNSNSKSKSNFNNTDINNNNTFKVNQNDDNTKINSQKHFSINTSSGNNNLANNRSSSSSHNHGITKSNNNNNNYNDYNLNNNSNDTNEKIGNYYNEYKYPVNRDYRELIDDYSRKSHNKSNGEALNLRSNRENAFNNNTVNNQYLDNNTVNDIYSQSLMGYLHRVVLIQRSFRRFLLIRNFTAEFIQKHIKGYLMRKKVLRYLFALRVMKQHLLSLNSIVLRNILRSFFWKLSTHKGFMYIMRMIVLLQRTVKAFLKRLNKSKRILVIKSKDKLQGQLGCHLLESLFRKIIKLKSLDKEIVNSCAWKIQKYFRVSQNRVLIRKILGEARESKIIMQKKRDMELEELRKKEKSTLMRTKNKSKDKDDISNSESNTKQIIKPIDKKPIEIIKEVIFDMRFKHDQPRVIPGLFKKNNKERFNKSISNAKARFLQRNIREFLKKALEFREEMCSRIRDLKLSPNKSASQGIINNPKKTFKEQQLHLFLKKSSNNLVLQKWIILIQRHFRKLLEKNKLFREETQKQESFLLNNNNNNSNSNSNVNNNYLIEAKSTFKDEELTVSHNIENLWFISKPNNQKCFLQFQRINNFELCLTICNEETLKDENLTLTSNMENLRNLITTQDNTKSSLQPTLPSNTSKTNFTINPQQQNLALLKQNKVLDTEKAVTLTDSKQFSLANTFLSINAHNKDFKLATDFSVSNQVIFSLQQANEPKIKSKVFSFYMAQRLLGNHGVLSKTVKREFNGSLRLLHARETLKKNIYQFMFEKQRALNARLKQLCSKSGVSVFYKSVTIKNTVTMNSNLIKKHFKEALEQRKTSALLKVRVLLINKSCMQLQMPALFKKTNVEKKNPSCLIKAKELVQNKIKDFSNDKIQRKKAEKPVKTMLISFRCLPMVIDKLIKLNSKCFADEHKGDLNITSNALSFESQAKKPTAILSIINTEESNISNSSLIKRNLKLVEFSKQFSSKAYGKMIYLTAKTIQEAYRKHKNASIAKKSKSTSSKIANKENNSDTEEIIVCDQKIAVSEVKGKTNFKESNNKNQMKAKDFDSTSLSIITSDKTLIWKKPILMSLWEAGKDHNQSASTACNPSFTTKKITFDGNLFHLKSLLIVKKMKEYLRKKRIQKALIKVFYNLSRYLSRFREIVSVEGSIEKYFKHLRSKLKHKFILKFNASKMVSEVLKRIILSLNQAKKQKALLGGFLYWKKTSVLETKAMRFSTGLSQFQVTKFFTQLKKHFGDYQVAANKLKLLFTMLDNKLDFSSLKKSFALWRNNNSQQKTQAALLEFSRENTTKLNLILRRVYKRLYFGKLLSYANNRNQLIGKTEELASAIGNYQKRVSLRLFLVKAKEWSSLFENSSLILDKISLPAESNHLSSKHSIRTNIIIHNSNQPSIIIKELSKSIPPIYLKPLVEYMNKVLKKILLGKESHSKKEAFKAIEERSKKHLAVNKLKYLLILASRKQPLKKELFDSKQSIQKRLFVIKFTSTLQSQEHKSILECLNTFLKNLSVISEIRNLTLVDPVNEELTTTRITHADGFDFPVQRKSPLITQDKEEDIINNSKNIKDQSKLKNFNIKVKVTKKKTTDTINVGDLDFFEKYQKRDEKSRKREKKINNLYDSLLRSNAVSNINTTHSNANNKNNLSTTNKFTIINTNHPEIKSHNTLVTPISQMFKPEGVFCLKNTGKRNKFVSSVILEESSDNKEVSAKLNSQKTVLQVIADNNNEDDNHNESISMSSSAYNKNKDGERNTYHPGLKRNMKALMQKHDQNDDDADELGDAEMSLEKDIVIKNNNKDGKINNINSLNNQNKLLLSISQIKKDDDSHFGDDNVKEILNHSFTEKIITKKGNTHAAYKGGRIKHKKEKEIIALRDPTEKDICKMHD